MQRALKHLFTLLSLVYLTSVFGPIQTFGASNPPPKKARWSQPAAKQSSKASKRSGQKKNKSPVATKKPKKKAPEKKSAPLSEKKPTKEKASKSVDKTKKQPAKSKPAAKAPAKELTLQQPMTDEDIDPREERSTSPLLFVFAAFVLACVGGMFFISARRKQMETARANFQDHTSNHDAAFRSRASDLDMTPISEHSAPTTSSLFNQAAPTGRYPSAKESLFDKIANKASGLLRSSKSQSPSKSEMTPMPKSAFSFSDDTSAGDSITTISAVKSPTRRAERSSNAVSQSTQESLSSSSTGSSQMSAQGEPCSFERYTEIQIACRCWRTQELPVNQMLQKTFGINIEELIQLEFYWKQKISGNLNLRKKFEELEPLYTEKYQAAS